MDSEKGNRVFARGAQCAPPWFLEPKKSLVWIGLMFVCGPSENLRFDAMREHPKTLPKALRRTYGSTKFYDGYWKRPCRAKKFCWPNAKTTIRGPKRET